MGKKKVVWTKVTEGNSYIQSWNLNLEYHFGKFLKTNQIWEEKEILI